MNAQRRAVAEPIARGLLLTVGGALLVATITAGADAAWAMKENTAAHATDIAAINDKFQRVLDLLCVDKPHARACQQ